MNSSATRPAKAGKKSGGNYRGKRNKSRDPWDPQALHTVTYARHPTCPGCPSIRHHDRGRMGP